jgi:hypothetical protein
VQGMATTARLEVPRLECRFEHPQTPASGDTNSRGCKVPELRRLFTAALPDQESPSSSPGRAMKSGRLRRRSRHVHSLLTCISHRSWAGCSGRECRIFSTAERSTRQKLALHPLSIVRALRALTAFGNEQAAIAVAYDWTGVTSVVDVGAGAGALLPREGTSRTSRSPSPAPEAFGLTRYRNQRYARPSSPADTPRLAR